MSNLYFLNKDSLNEFLTWLGTYNKQDYQVLVPTKRNRSVVFSPFDPQNEVCFDKASSSPKAVVLPACETLIRYKLTKNPEQLEQVSLSLDDTPKATPTIVFGCRPCDARGFTVLDRPYTQGPYQDPYYMAKRATMLVITRACTETCSTCFCHWVGSGPLDKTGSDILLTELAAGYVLQGVSEQGIALLENSNLAQAGDKQDDVKKAHAAAGASLDKRPDLKDIAQSLAKRFTDEDFWAKQTAHCLSCGACTYICPTCYCFNITDEGDGLTPEGGKRMRTWDTCMASHFTREASGHNPRTAKALRMRNRITHKFSYYPQVWNNQYSCNGCGRCISQCPVHLDIRSIVLAALKDTPAAPVNTEDACTTTAVNAKKD